MKKRILLSSICTLVLCVCIISGATFALFTSESKTNVTIRSGKVEYVSTIENLKTYSMEVLQTSGSFENGGSANISENQISLDLMTPGDKVEFEIIIANNSTVTTQYQVVVSKAADNGLFAGLKVTINEATFIGIDSRTEWTKLNAGSNPESIKVSIELPVEAENEYQDKNTKLLVAVYAVQGNAEVDHTDVWDGTIEELPTVSDIIIENAAEFAAFAASVNAGNNYEGYTVKLNASIDLANNAWEAINDFAGTFDGQGHTIYNLKDAVLFNKLSGNAVVSNLNINGANRKFNGYTNKGTAVFVNSVTNNALVYECKVSNVTLEWESSVTDSGDGVAGVISGVDTNATVQNCEFNNININSNGKLKRTGGIFSSISGTVVNCKVNNVNVVTTTNGFTQQAGGFVGTVNKTAYISNCVLNDVAVTTEYAALKTGGFAGLLYGGTIKDCNLNNVKMVVAKTYSEFGGFVGQVDSRTNAVRATIENCHVEGLDMTIGGYPQSLSGASAGFISSLSGAADITNCSVKGKIDDTAATQKNHGHAVGGFVGDAGNATYTVDGVKTSIVHNITNCVADVEIITTDSVVGAFVARAGRAHGVDDAFNYFNFVNCEAKGTITIVDGGSGTAGQFYGQIFGTENTFNGCKVNGEEFNA